MMKRAIGRCIQALLAGIVVLLGFQSCATKRGGDTADPKQNGESGVVSPQRSDNDSCQSQAKIDSTKVKPRPQRSRKEPPPVVYGPPPTRFRQ